MVHSVGFFRLLLIHIFFTASQSPMSHHPPSLRVAQGGPVPSLAAAAAGPAAAEPAAKATTPRLKRGVLEGLLKDKVVSDLNPPAALIDVWLREGPFLAHNVRRENVQSYYWRARDRLRKSKQARFGPMLLCRALPNATLRALFLEFIRRP